MIEKNSLRDQFLNKNLYDILVNWSYTIRRGDVYCIRDVVYNDQVDCQYELDCEKCIQHLMNEVVPSQTGQ